MVVMVILSMMLFTMDGIFSDTSANLWLLGMLIGSAAFGIAGIGSGRWIQWGIGGAILGTVLGLVLPEFAAGGGISSTIGTFHEARIRDLGTRRDIANRLINQVNPGARFNYGHRNQNLDLIFGSLMQAEADELGIAVDAEGVSKYLSTISGDTLTEETYLAARNSMSYQGNPLDEETFQEILSDEIRARMAYMMLQTRTMATPPSPDDYWQYFRRLNVQQKIEVATLKVDQFLDEIDEPTDGQIKELFEEYKDYFPSNKEPGSPGFALPHRANLAYIELDAESVQKSLDAVSDEDIKKYYEDNKETPLIRSIVIPDDDAKGEEAEDAAGDPAAQEATTEEGRAAEEGSAAEKEEGEKAAGDMDAAAESSEGNAKDKAEEAAGTDAPTSKPADKEDESKDEKVEKKDESSPEKSATDADAEKEAQKAAKKANRKAKKKAAKEEAAQQSVKKPVFPQEQADAASEATGGEPADKAVKSAATTQDAAAVKDDAAAEDDADAQDEAATQDKPAATDGLEIPDMSSLPDVPSMDESSLPEPEYEYRELDDELSGQIRELILADRVSSEMAARMKTVQGEMELLARKYSRKRLEMLEADPKRYSAPGNGPEEEEKAQQVFKELRESMRDFYAELNSDLKKLGEKHGFAFVETGLIGFLDLRDSEDFTIGAATEPSANPMLQFQATPMVNSVYSGLSSDEQSNAGLMFKTAVAVRPGSAEDEPERRFLYWVSDISPQHAPTLDEAGVREAVVKAWKSQQAREIVETRGKKLVQQVKAGLAKEGDEKQNLVEALEGETVTGKADGVPLARRVSMSFSWMRVTQAPQMSFQQPRPQAEQSFITFAQDDGAPLDQIGQQFMQTIFEDMKNGDVQVVPNFDFSAYHVVHVTDRFPTPEVGEDGLRDDFAKESVEPSLQYRSVLSQMSSDLHSPPARKWQESIWKKYQIDLNAGAQ